MSQAEGPADAGTAAPKGPPRSPPSSTASGLTLVRGAEAIHALRDAWQALAHRAGASPFQHPAWLESWYATLGAGAEPWLVLVEEPEPAFLALALRRTRGLRTLVAAGHGCSDWIGLAPLDAPAATWEAVARCLGSETHRFDLLHLRGLLASASTRRTFVRGFGGLGAERVYERCPFIDTASGWETYLSTRKKKFRANLKRAERRVEAVGALTVQMEPPSAALFDAMVEVERASWKWNAGRAFLRDDALRALLRRVLLGGGLPLELWTLRVGERLAGFAVVLLRGEERLYYLPSFREDVPDAGSHLLRVIVEDAFSGRFRRFDFLQGDERYKLAWATGIDEVHELALAPPTLRGRLALGALSARWRLARSERAHRLRAWLTGKRGGTPTPPSDD